MTITGQYNDIASPNLLRYGHTAIKLRSNRILIIGGTDDTFEAWYTCPPWATLILPDGPEGTERNGGPNFRKAEIFDPRDKSYYFTGNLNVPRRFHTATLLQDGKVLIIGGIGTCSYYGTNNLEDVELYDPNTGSFSIVTSLSPLGRHYHTTTLLNNGKVLVVGGISLCRDSYQVAQGSAYLYDPATQSFSPTTGYLNRPRYGHAATLLPDGRVLIVGGSVYDADGLHSTPVEDIEIFDPNTNRFLIIPNTSWIYGNIFRGILLSNGKVLYGPTVPSSSNPSQIIIFDPATNIFSSVGEFPNYGDEASPYETSAILLDDGTVHFFGVLINTTRSDGTPSLATSSIAVIYDPATNTMTMDSSIGDGGRKGRGFHTATLLHDGTVLILGGIRGIMPRPSNYHQVEYIYQDKQIHFIPSNVNLGPNPPSNLQATAISSSEIHLEWQDNSTNETEFRVEQLQVTQPPQPWIDMGAVEANQESASIIGLPASTEFCYRVRAKNAIAPSPYSNTDCATTLGAGPQVARFSNYSSRPIVSLIVDGTQYTPDATSSIPSGYYFELPLSQGMHSYIARNGWWDGGNRFEMYEWQGTFNQPNDTVSIDFNDPTIFQLLTQWSSEHTWTGYYFDVDANMHSTAYEFRNNGTYTFYIDGTQRGTGTYYLVSRTPSFFTVDFATDHGSGVYYELYQYFTICNGPSDCNVAYCCIDHYG